MYKMLELSSKRSLPKVTEQSQFKRESRSTPREYLARFLNIA